MLAFLMNEDGATALEYTLIASLVVIGIISVLVLTGETLNTMYQAISDAFVT